MILDSFSHEYDGEGGILDWAAELEARGTKPPGNWKDPKLGHKRLMNALLQVRCHLIFCLRADEKIEIVRENGRTQVRPLGWMPICEKRFMFEMTASFTLTPDRPGVPQYHLPHKVQEQHRGMFPEGEAIGERAGETLRAWAAGGVDPVTPPAPVDKAAAGVAAMLAEIADVPDMQALLQLVDRTLTQRQWLEEKRPELHETVTAALREQHERLADAEVPST